MSTLHKFKAYFGMVPLEDYEDDYIDEPAPARRPARNREPARDYADVDDADYRSWVGYGRGGERGEYHQDDFRREEFDAEPRRAPRLEPLPPRSPRVAAAAGRTSTRGALAVDSATEARRSPAFEEPRTALTGEAALSKITTLRPRDYGEARTIGERFREGNPVIMDLVEMSNADAKRLVDFAAGLAFALRGSFDKVATKVFLLSPADVDVSAEERRRIAEKGFYSR